MRSQLVLGALALVVGFSIAAAPRVLGGGDDEHLTDAARGHPRAIPTAPIATPRAPTVPQVAVAAGPEAPAPPAASPEAAVDAFLGAEANGDFAISYGLLAADDRATQRSRAGWTAAHAQLPVIRHFAIGAVRVSGGRAEVDARLTLRPELDPVVGLVPGRASGTWIAIAEDGGWRVSFADSAIVPDYPRAGRAPAAARAWVADRAGCREHARPGLLSSGRLADALCSAPRGRVQVGVPGELEPGESSDPFLAAYGPDVFTWARVVPVTSPARVGAVLAPLGPRWRVIGLVDLPSMQPIPSEGAEL